MTGGIYNRCVARGRLLIGGQRWAPVQYKDRKGAATGRSDQSGERSMSQTGMEGTNWDVTLTFDHVYGNLHVKKCSHNTSTHLKTNKICQFCFLSPRFSSFHSRKTRRATSAIHGIHASQQNLRTTELVHQGIGRICFQLVH